LVAELETRVDQLKALETDMKNLFYWEKEARGVLDMIISSLLTSATSTWSFALRRIVTSSTATNLCRS
jgi:P2-related tail formation protein